MKAAQIVVQDRGKCSETAPRCVHGPPCRFRQRNTFHKLHYTVNHSALQMAPPLAESQRVRMRHMNASKNLFTANQIARVAECSFRTVYGSRNRAKATRRASSQGVGRPRTVTPRMIDALREHLRDQPTLYLDEMVRFLWNKFGVFVTTYSVGRALKSIGWTKKTVRRVAQGRNDDLRDLHIHNMAGIRSWQLVFVDESGCDQRGVLRRTGWAPLGVTPVEVSWFRREKRYQILPPYTQDGIIFARVFQGSTTAEVFEEFIEQLLPFMNPWPQKNSVLVTDNASIHHSARIKQMCRDADVRLVFLPPYSPDLNPIEEFFAELKAFLKRN